MSDLLSSASLILAVVGVLYGLWYSEIQKVLEKDVPKHVEDRGIIYREISSTILSRTLPLTLLALLVSLIYLRDTLKISSELIAQIVAGGITKFVSEYDTVSVALCVVEFLTISIGVHTLVLSIKLIKMRFFR